MELESNIKSQEKIAVQCMANLPKRLELRADHISYSPTAKTESIRKLSFTNNGETPVNILSVESPDERLVVEIEEMAAGKRYQITAKIPPQFEAEEGAAIVLKTDDAEKPELRIPLRSSRAVRTTPPPRPAEDLRGKPAPVHAAKTYDGKDVQIGGESEDVQVLVFYASWCGFCKRALPKIEELNKELKSAGKAAEIIAINLDDRSGRRARTEEQSLEHFQKLELTMPMVLDSKKLIGHPYKVASFPTMFVVGKSGVVEAVHIGAKQDFEKALATEVDMLLAGKTRADFPADAAAMSGAAPANVVKANPDAAGPANATTEGDRVAVPASDKNPES
jgi:thiol-disulfide isomerase/thioredoxin